MQSADSGAVANGRRIAVNAAVTYARSLIALVLGLFSARWVLAALGAVDFGLYAVVGSMMAFVSFVRNVMVMPPDRLLACLWTFRLALVTLFVTVASVPFNAMYIAHQRFGKLAAFGLVQTAVMFCGAWWLRGAGCDRLIAYAGYMTLAFAGVAAAQTVGVLIEFPVCRHPLAPLGTGGRIRSLLSFAGWSVFGTGGWIVGAHGSAFVTNRFFGATANAAYGVSTQVQYHTEALANALVGAFEPAVTSQEGAGKRDMSVQCGSGSGS